VQAWFGQFIHGVLEEAYRRYDAARRDGREDSPPWPAERIAEIGELIKRRLAAQGLFPWGGDLEELGALRAEAAVNDLGPELFPLIRKAEVRLTGARMLPIERIETQYRFREADRYEVKGVIDVITSVELNDPRLQSNRLLRSILAQLPSTPPNAFEVIIDYKGMRRPPVTDGPGTGPSFWDIYGWQVQTYADLRGRQEDSLPVIAGVIIYLNELLPQRNDLASLRREMAMGQTDVAPEVGSETARILSAWRDDDIPALPLDFRLQRAMRVLSVSGESKQDALLAFDDVVARIEICRGKELRAGRVVSTWEKNPDDEDTCTACDARAFCPSYTKENAPRLPATRGRR
jgi:hypothetical protein